jgi:predicted peptidase
MMVAMKSRFNSLPSRLQSVAEETNIGEVPCLLVRDTLEPSPFIIWIHGRTADKELDPGRYLRYVRKGINVCAVDLPGHGARFEDHLQDARHSIEVVLKMASEIDSVLMVLDELGGFDLKKAAIGGMSAGGMAVIQRLLEPHHFSVAVLEATVGNLEPMRDLPLCEGLSDAELHAINPIEHLDGWSDIPIIAFHSRHDSWIPILGQESFITALKEQYANPEKVEFISFDRTGAPYEHIGFGRESAFVKEVQVEFVAKHLQIGIETS